MNEQEFLEKMVEIMDTEAELEMNSNLEDIEEWDSLSYVAFLALCQSEDRDVIPKDVRNAKTINELYALFMGTK